MLAETYLELLTDPGHWAFELTVEAVTFAAGAAWGWARVKRHVHRDIDRAVRDLERQHKHEQPHTADPHRDEDTVV